MSSKTEKKRKVGGRGGPRAGRGVRAAQSAVAAEAADASLLSPDQEPDSEATKVESGEYLLEEKVLRNGGPGRLERLLQWVVFVFAFGDKFFLCSSGWSQTGSVDQAGLDLNRDLPAFALQILGKVRTSPCLTQECLGAGEPDQGVGTM